MEVEVKQILVLAMAMSIVALAGCASSGSDVIVDPAYVNRAQYDQDLAECEGLAKQVRQKAGRRAAKGAVVGGLIGAIFGGKRSAEKGAGIGGA